MRYALTVLLGVAVACGGAPAARPTPTQEDALVSFADCLRRQGINVADPEFLPDGGWKLLPASGRPVTPRHEFEAAVAGCKPILTAAGLKLPNERDDDIARDITVEDRALGFAACVRTAGFDLPDPAVEDGRVTNWDPEALGIDLDDPDVQRVADRCARTSGFDPRKE